MQARKFPFKFYAILALLLTGLAFQTACDPGPGGGDDSGIDQPPPPPNTPAQPEPSPQTGNSQPGALCPSINGGGSVPFGGACNDSSDCADGMPCCIGSDCSDPCTCV